MDRTPGSSSLTVLAWSNVVVHGIALVFAALGMRPGSPLVSLPQRLEYLAQAPLDWTLGWVSWMICSVLLLAFLTTVTRYLGPNADLARLGLVVAVVGAAFDLFCDSVYIVGLPLIASWQPVPERLFLLVERLTGLGSLVIANGAYSVAILLVSATLSGRSGFDRSTVLLGFAVGASGLVLAGAGFTGGPWHAEWATPPTIGLFCVWVVLLARSFARGENPP